MGQLLTITRAARYLGIGRESMRRLVDEGRVTTVVLRRRRLVTLPSLRTLIGDPAAEPVPARLDYDEAADRLMEDHG